MIFYRTSLKMLVLFLKASFLRNTPIVHITSSCAVYLCIFGCKNTMRSGTTYTGSEIKTHWFDDLSWPKLSILNVSIKQNTFDQRNVKIATQSTSTATCRRKSQLKNVEGRAEFKEEDMLLPSTTVSAMRPFVRLNISSE